MSFCAHCNQRILDLHRVKGIQFCCSGCSVAYNLIKDYGLEQYYKNCKEVYNTIPNRPKRPKKEIDKVNYITYVASDNNNNSIELHIEGIQCGACVWLVENVLMNQEAVTSAKVYISTRKLVINWKGNKKTITRYVNLIKDIGFFVVPFVYDEIQEKKEIEKKDLIKRIAVASAAFIQVMMFSIPIWLHGDMSEYTRNLLHWFSALIALPAILYSARPFYLSAIIALKSKRSNMDVIITIAILCVCFISIEQTIKVKIDSYFDSALMLIVVLLIGRYYDTKVRNKNFSLITSFVQLEPKITKVLKNGKIYNVESKSVKVGDTIVIKKGDRVAVDAEVIKGNSNFDISIITGESKSVKVDIGTKIIAGSINLTKIIHVRALSTTKDSYIKEIIALLEKAVRSKSRYIKVSERVSKFYTPSILSLGIFTYFYQNMYLGYPFDIALERGVSILLITCPCAVGLAIPMVHIIASSLAIRKGIFIKEGDVFERLLDIDTIVFDKTGTLTYGRPKLLNPKILSPFEQKLVLSIARQSNHPLCVALEKGIAQKSIMNLDVEEVTGSGMKAFYKGEKILLGSAKFCGIKESDDVKQETCLMYKNKVKRLKFQDKLRDTAKDAVRILQKEGYKLYILSGDKREVVLQCGKKLGIKDCYSGKTPGEKVSVLRALQEKGRKVLMLGDGINDLASLKQAEVSFSPMNAISISAQKSDVVFKEDLYSIIDSISMAKKSTLIMKQNIGISLLYNAVAIPIAMLGYVTPWLAAFFMACSSVVVVVNSLRLKGG